MRIAHAKLTISIALGVAAACAVTVFVGIRTSPDEPTSVGDTAHEEPAVAAPVPPAPAREGIDVAAAADPTPAAPEVLAARLRDARAAYFAAASDEERAAAVAAVAASGDEARFQELLTVYETGAGVAVREAAILALAAPEASALVERLHAALARETEPTLRLALRVAIGKIEARPVQCPDAFTVSAEFEAVTDRPNVVHVRATARRRDAGGPVGLRVDWTSEKKGGDVPNRWSGPLAPGGEAVYELDVTLPEDAPPQVFEITASGKAAGKGLLAASTRFLVHLEAGRVVVGPAEPVPPPPTEEVR